MTVNRAWQKAARAVVATAATAMAASTAFAQAPACPSGLRKINIGVAVSPPNVVHTAPYIARDLGFFAKRCVEPNIVQFDGGAAGTSITAVAQGSAISNLNSAAIAQGVKGRMIWGLAPLPPQSYVVSADIKTLADLKGKRLSAAGGVGGFNWLMGREALRKAGLKVEDATFISQGTAGRLPGLLAGQLDGVVLHPEDVHLAQEKKPGTHILISLTELVPEYFFNAYGAQNEWVKRDRPLLLDTIAAMIEANRAFYNDKAKVLPIVQKATEKAPEAVEFAWNFITKNCILSVNEGLPKDRLEWTHENDIANGDVPPEKKLTVDQIADFEFAKEAVQMAGGPTTIGQCKL